MDPNYYILVVGKIFFFGPVALIIDFIFFLLLIHLSEIGDYILMR